MAEPLDGEALFAALDAAVRSNETECLMVRDKFDTLAIWIARNAYPLDQDRRAALGDVVREVGVSIVAEMRAAAGSRAMRVSGGARE